MERFYKALKGTLAPSPGVLQPETEGLCFLVLLGFRFSGLIRGLVLMA